jgi:hypothetical protein
MLTDVLKSKLAVEQCSVTRAVLTENGNLQLAAFNVLKEATLILKRGEGG